MDNTYTYQSLEEQQVLVVFFYSPSCFSQVVKEVQDDEVGLVVLYWMMCLAEHQIESLKTPMHS